MITTMFLILAPLVFSKGLRILSIACVLAPIVNNGRHSYLFLTQQAGICERQARRENGTQAQSTVYAQSNLESKPGAVRN